MTDLPHRIDEAWNNRETLSVATTGPYRDAVDSALELLDSGEARVAEPDGSGGWVTHQWLKKAVLLSFRLNDNAVMPGPGGANWFDKVPSKFQGWGAMPAFAPCRAPSSAAAPISRPAPC
jgi:2,3,4,5-tetrahydropyridine-2,6-dicarboxylate N-succinyltransferase